MRIVSRAAAGGHGALCDWACVLCNLCRKDSTIHGTRHHRHRI